MGDEMQVRQFVHRKIVVIDKHYQSFESIHMDERTGVITVKWIDREGHGQTNTFMFHRSV